MTSITTLDPTLLPDESDNNQNETIKTPEQTLQERLINDPKELDSVLYPNSEFPNVEGIAGVAPSSSDRYPAAYEGATLKIVCNNLIFPIGVANVDVAHDQEKIIPRIKDKAEREIGSMLVRKKLLNPKNLDHRSSMREFVDFAFEKSGITLHQGEDLVVLSDDDRSFSAGPIDLLPEVKRYNKIFPGGYSMAPAKLVSRADAMKHGLKFFEKAMHGPQVVVIDHGYEAEKEKRKRNLAAKNALDNS